MFRIQSKLDPRTKQRVKLAEIGARLREVRDSREISLDTIARETSIPLRFLEAIEAGDLDNLPEPVTVRWLISRFANYLSIDGEEISRRFPTGEGFSWKLPKIPRLLPDIQIRPIHLYFLYLLLVIGSVQAVSRVLEKSALQSNRLPPPSLPVEQAKDRSNPVRPVATNAPASGQVVVEIKAKEDCWIRVVADGKTEFEGLLGRGTQRVWQADKALTVRAGNAGGVYIAVNNEDAKKLGEPGKVQEVTYTANR